MGMYSYVFPLTDLADLGADTGLNDEVRCGWRGVLADMLDGMGVDKAATGSGSEG